MNNISKKRAPAQQVDSNENQPKKRKKERGALQARSVTNPQRHWGNFSQADIPVEIFEKFFFYLEPEDLNNFEAATFYSISDLTSSSWEKISQISWNIFEGPNRHKKDHYYTQVVTALHLYGICYATPDKRKINEIIRNNQALVREEKSLKKFAISLKKCEPLQEGHELLKFLSQPYSPKQALEWLMRDGREIPTTPDRKWEAREKTYGAVHFFLDMRWKWHGQEPKTELFTKIVELAEKKFDHKLLEKSSYCGETSSFIEIKNIIREICCSYIATTRGFNVNIMKRAAELVATTEEAIQRHRANNQELFLPYNYFFLKALVLQFQQNIPFNSNADFPVEIIREYDKFISYVATNKISEFMFMINKCLAVCQKTGVYTVDEALLVVRIMNNVAEAVRIMDDLAESADYNPSSYLIARFIVSRELNFKDAEEIIKIAEKNDIKSLNTLAKQCLGFFYLRFEQKKAWDIFEELSLDEIDERIISKETFLYEKLLGEMSKGNYEAAQKTLFLLLDIILKNDKKSVISSAAIRSIMFDINFYKKNWKDALSSLTLRDLREERTLISLLSKIEIKNLFDSQGQSQFPGPKRSRIALCFYYLENFTEAAKFFKHVITSLQDQGRPGYLDDHLLSCMAVTFEKTKDIEGSTWTLNMMHKKNMFMANQKQ